MPLLKVMNLKINYRTLAGDVQAVNNVSFQIDPGMNFGLVGESGCGKSTLVKAIITCMSPNAYIADGSIWFKDNDLTRLDEKSLQKIRWKDISMITQSAMNSLDPVYTVGKQIVEAIQAHESIHYVKAKERVEKMFALVGIDKKRFSEYPHQFSGGMRQRAIIAMALVLEPSFVIADEPTTALDVIVQDQIFKNIKELQRVLNFSMLLVTHDIAVVVENCDAIGVMYAGKLVEVGNIGAVINTPFHPYTMGLKNSFPNIKDIHAKQISIPGFPPTLIGKLKGCMFQRRCPFSLDICSLEGPLMMEVGKNHYAACHNIKKADEIREKAKLLETWEEHLSQ